MKKSPHSFLFVFFLLFLALPVFADKETDGDVAYEAGQYSKAIKLYQKAEESVYDISILEHKIQKCKILLDYIKNAQQAISSEEYEVARRSYEDAYNIHEREYFVIKMKDCDKKIEDQRMKFEEEDFWSDVLDYKNMSNQAEAAEDYLARYPHGAHVKEALSIVNDYQKEIDDNAWYSACNSNTVTAYNDYKTRFPQGVHILEVGARIQSVCVQDEIVWNAAAEENSLSGYRNYVEKGFLNHLSEAKAKISVLQKEYNQWQKCLKERNIVEIQAFISSYPHSQYVEDAHVLLEEIKDDEAWNQAITINTSDAYREYLANYSRHATLANFYIEKELWETAKNTNTVLAYQKYLDSGYTTHKEEAINNKNTISVQEQRIANAETLFAQKKMELAYLEVAEARKLGNLPIYLKNRALECEEPFAYKNAKKSKSSSIMRDYQFKYTSVAPAQHLSAITKAIIKTDERNLYNTTIHRRPMYMEPSDSYRYYFLDAICGYNTIEGDWFLGGSFAVQRYKIGGFLTYEYGIYSGNSIFEFGPSFRFVPENKKIDCHFFLGPSIVTDFSSISYGGTLGLRIGSLAGKQNKRFCWWSGSIGISAWSNGEIMPYIGFSIPVGLVGAGSAAALLVSLM